MSGVFSGSTFDVNGIYQLGNAWSEFGDTLSEQIAAMQSAVESFTWSGEGAVAFGLAWGLIHGKALAPLPELAWNIGEEINYYGQQAEADEKKAVKAENAAALAEVFGIMLGAAMGGLGDLMAPLLEGLVDALTGLLSNVISAIGSIVVRGVATFVGEAVINGAVQFGADMIGQGLADAIEHVPFTVNWKSEGIGVAAGAAFGLPGLGADLKNEVGNALKDTPKITDDAEDPFVEPLHVGEPDIGADVADAAGARVPDFGADPLPLKSGEFGALEGEGGVGGLTGLKSGADDVNVVTGSPDAAAADGRGVSDAPGPRTSETSADSSVSGANPVADAGRPGAAVDAGAEDVGARGATNGFTGDVRQTLGGTDSSVAVGERAVDPGRPGAAVGAGPEDVGSRGATNGFTGDVRQTAGGADSSVTPGHAPEDGGRPSTPDAGVGNTEPRAADSGPAADSPPTVKSAEPPAEPGRQAADSGRSAPGADSGAQGVEPRSGETGVGVSDSHATDSHVTDPRASGSSVTDARASDSSVTDSHSTSSGSSVSDAHEQASQRTDAGGGRIDPAGQASHADQAGHTDQAGHVDQVSRTDQAGHAEQVGHVDQAGHVDQVGHTDQAGHASAPAAAPPVPARAADAGLSRSDRWQDAQHDLQQQYTDRFDYTDKTERVHDLVDAKVRQEFDSRADVRQERGLDAVDLSEAGRERVLERFQTDVKNLFDSRFGTPGHGYDTAVDHVGIVADRLDGLGDRLSSRVEHEVLWEQQRDLAHERFVEAYDAHPEVAPRIELLGPQGAGRVEAERSEAWQQFEPQLRKAFDKLADRPEFTPSESWDRTPRESPPETGEAARQTAQSDLASRVSAKFNAMLRDDAPRGISLRNRLEQELQSGREFTDGQRSHLYGNPPDEVWHGVEREVQRRIASDFKSVYGEPFARARPYRANADDAWAVRREGQAGLVPETLARLGEFGSGFRARFDETVAARDTTRAERGLNLERPAENPDYGLSYTGPTSESARDGGIRPPGQHDHGDSAGLDGVDIEVDTAHTGAEIAPSIEQWRPGRDISTGGLERVRKDFDMEVRTAFEQHFHDVSLDDRHAWASWVSKTHDFFSSSLPRRLEYEAGFERELGSASKTFESSYERWSNDLAAGGQLDAGAESRVREQFAKDLHAAYDETFQRDLGRIGERDRAGEADPAWQRTSGQLLAGADRRFAGEEELVRAVRGGADGFDSLSREFPITREHADELASSYRTDVAHRHEEIYGDTERNLTSWLEHEQAHGDGFGGRLTELQDLRETRLAEARARAEADAKAAEAGTAELRNSEVPGTERPAPSDHSASPPEAGHAPDARRADTGESSGGDAAAEASGAAAGEPGTRPERPSGDSAPHDASTRQDTDSVPRDATTRQDADPVPHDAPTRQDADPAPRDATMRQDADSVPRDATTRQDTDSADQEQLLAQQPGPSRAQSSRNAPQGAHEANDELAGSPGAHGPRHSSDEAALGSASRDEAHVGGEPQRFESPQHSATGSTHDLGEQTVAVVEAHDSVPRSLDAHDAHDARTSGPDAGAQATSSATVGQWPEAQEHLDAQYAGRLSAVQRIESRRPDAAAVYRRIVEAERPRDDNASALVLAARNEQDIPGSAVFKQVLDAAYDRVWTPLARTGLAVGGPGWLETSGRWELERERLENTLTSLARLASPRLDRADDAVRDAQAARVAWSARQQTGEHDAGLIDEALDAFQDHQRQLFLGTYGRLAADGRIDPNASYVYDNAYRSLVHDIDGFRDAAQAQRTAQESAGARFDEAVRASAVREPGHDTGLELAPLSLQPRSDSAALFDAVFGLHWHDAVSRHLPELRDELVDAVRGGAAFRASPAAVERARDAAGALDARVELAGVFADALPQLRDGIAEAVREFPRELDVLAVRNVARLVVGRADAMFRQVVADAGRRSEPARSLRDGLDTVAESAARLLEFEGSLHTRVNRLVESSAQESAGRIGVRVARISSRAAVQAVDELTAADRRTADSDSADALSHRLRELLDETEQRFAFETAAGRAMAAADARVKRLVADPRSAVAAALDGDGIQRLRVQHLAAARSAVDEARAELVEHRFSPARTSEVTVRLESAMRGLAESTPGRLTAEADLTAALTEAGDRFGRQAEAYDLPGRALAAVAADYRREWMSARALAFGVEVLDLASWLDHEREHADRFGASAGARIREVDGTVPEDSAEASDADRLFAHASVHVEEIEDEQADGRPVGGTVAAEAHHLLEEIPSQRESVEAVVEDWRKSTFSPVGPGAACVQVAALAMPGRARVGRRGPSNGTDEH